MIYSTKFAELLVTDRIEVEQMQMLIVNAIDDLEQLSRARELTNAIWEAESMNCRTDKSLQRLEVLLESYERTRDESLESALAKLKELSEVLNNTVSSSLSSPEIDINIGIGLT